MMSVVGLVESDEKKFQVAIMKNDEEKALRIARGERKGNKETPASSDFDDKKPLVMKPSQPFQSSGNTAMHMAAEYGMLKLCKLFLDHGGNPNVLNSTEQTALHALCLQNNNTTERFGILEKLLSWKGEVVLNTNHGTIVSSSGEEEDSMRTTNIVYSEEVSINRVDEEGCAAVHYASQNGLTPIVCKLVTAGAIISIVNKAQRTCCELAEAQGHHQLSSMLELALIFQPVDAGLEAFEQNLHEDGDQNLPIYCLDCRSYSTNDIENYMSELINRTCDALLQPSERVETLLNSYDWDVDALIREYSNDAKAVLESALLHVDLDAKEEVPVNTDKVSENSMDISSLDKSGEKDDKSNGISDKEIAQENVPPSPSSSSIVAPVIPIEMEFVDYETCRDVDFLLSEEKRLKDVCDIAGSMAVREALDKLANMKDGAEDDQQISPVVPEQNNDQKENDKVIPSIEVAVEAHVDQNVDECPICCEDMISEADFDSVMGKAMLLLEEGKDESDLCIVNSSEGLCLTCKSGHKFCVSCWCRHITGKVRDESFADLTCPGFKCGETLNKKWAPFLLMEDSTEENAVTRNRLPSVDVESASLVSGLLGRYRQARISRFIDCNRACQNCPVESCSLTLIIPNEQLKSAEETAKAINQSSIPQTVICAAGHSMCLVCRLEGHAPCSCKDWENWQTIVRKEMQSADLKNNNKGVPDIANALWLNANTKKCPRCSTSIEKDEGCNHMVCSKCRHEFCWMCMDKWSLHSNTTGGYFQCNKFKDENVGGDEVDSVFLKGSSRAEAERLRVSGRKMARFIHHFTRFSAHQDSSLREASMRLETLQRIEYTLYRTAMGDLPWLHQGVIVNPAEGKLTRRPSVGSAAQNRTPVKKTTNVTKSATGSTSTVSSSIASKMNKAANTLSKWFSPSKSREYGAKETPSTQVSAADAAYASTNFTKEDDDTAVASDSNLEKVFLTDGPSYLQFLRNGFDELSRARQLLRGTYIQAYFLFDTIGASRHRNRDWNLLHTQSVYEALQGELEFLVEMLSDVLARRRLRASEFQINQLVKSVRAKRIEMEASIISTANRPQDDYDIPDGMTSLSSNGSLGRSGVRNISVHNNRGRRSGREGTRVRRAEREEEDLMSMVTLLSQLSSERQISRADREERDVLVAATMERLRNNGFVFDPFPSGEAPNVELTTPPSPPGAGMHVRATTSDSIDDNSSDSSDSDDFTRRPIRQPGIPRSSPSRLSAASTSSPRTQGGSEISTMNMNMSIDNNSQDEETVIHGSRENSQFQEEMELQNALLMSLRTEPTFSSSEEQASQGNIQLIVSMMEVSEARAAEALMQNGHNVEAAINSLLSD